MGDPKLENEFTKERKIEERDARWQLFIISMVMMFSMPIIYLLMVCFNQEAAFSTNIQPLIVPIVTASLGFFFGRTSK